MKVLLSWSGERSRAMAYALRTWMADVNHALKPWMSAEDIGKGQRWANDLAQQLQDTDVGVICVTPENMLSPWILFEAGALSKALTNSLVCTYLFDVTPETLAGPLRLFQATVANQDDTRRLIHTLNSALGPGEARSADQIDRSFAIWWPQLEASLANVAKLPQPKGVERTDREVIDEILAMVRTTAMGVARTASAKGSERLELSGLLLGDDVQRLLTRLTSIVGSNSRDEGENNTEWRSLRAGVPCNAIDGAWRSRWNGGRASDRWMYGSANALSQGDYTVFLFQGDEQDSAIYLLICTVHGKNQLIGRYVNLDRPEDSTPWVGTIVDSAQIDGYWTEGRWDFRR
jgi:hypothetical protein